MTALLAIVKTVAEAEAAMLWGADRVAIAVENGADLGRTFAALQDRGGGDRSRLGLILANEDDDESGPADLAGRIRNAGLGAVWSSFAPERGRLGPALVSEGVSAFGLVSADVPVDEALCIQATAAGLSGLLLGGTPFSKTRLLDRRTIAELARIVPLCREHRLSVAFAGAVEPPDIPRLIACGPDELGVDLALLGDTGEFEPERLADIRRLFTREQERQSQAVPSAAVPDRILVRDYTVAMSIGAYQRERASPQRVRFSVEVEIASAPVGAAGMGSVVSYDLVTDAIARITQSHVDLVETVAEDLAVAVLSHPRALTVEITIEKLDVGPGIVGCRIVRRRP